MSGTCEWDSEGDTAYEILRTRLDLSWILKFPEISKELRLNIDASHDTFDSTLQEVKLNGKVPEVPGYFSK